MERLTSLLKESFAIQLEEYSVKKMLWEEKGKANEGVGEGRSQLKM